jgi:hypothetical protein
MSPISLYWKDDTPFSDLNGNNDSHITRCNTVTAPQSQTSTSPTESLGKESLGSAASPNKKNEDEVKTAYPQLTK